MRSSHVKRCWMLLIAMVWIVVGCAKNGGVSIDWVNFIKFNGITYTADHVKAGRELTAADLGKQFDTVKFEVSSNVHETGYKTKDGDAAFYKEGTPVYEVKGYSPQFRLAIQNGDQIVLFEADSNPKAEKGADLLDIANKVEYIGINSEEDGKTELASIRDKEIVERMVSMVLESKIDHDHDSNGKRYFIAFHLNDGTSTVRAFWLDSGELSRDILLPQAFTDEVREALEPSQVSLEDIAVQVLQALKAQSFEALGELVDPTEGVRFSPYSHIRVNHDLVFKAEQIKNMAQDNKVYHWGEFDGSGEPIELTMKEYFDQFVFDHDFTQAPQVGVNEVIGQGNTLNNIAEVYPPSSYQFVEFHFPGFEKQYEGMDWRSLRLVFKSSENTFHLVGIVHDQWTT